LNLDAAFLAGTSFQGTTAVYDASATATNLSSLTLDSTQLRPIFLSQALNSLTTAVEYVGSNRTGNLNISGGTHTVNGSLIFGNSAGASGNGSLSGGTLTTRATYLGNAGSGFFNQTGGTHFVGTNGLFIGFGTAATGTYVLSGGSLQAIANIFGSLESEVIGVSGVGIFNQSGGLNSANSPNGITLGQNSGSSGTYNQSGGTCFGDVFLGISAGATGTYNLSNSASLGVGEIEVGLGGNGTFNQTGGTLNGGSLAVPGNTGGSGTVNFSGGAALMNVITVGGAGRGQLTVVGGTATASGFMAISAGGTVTLNGGVLNLGPIYFSSGWSQLQFNGGTLNFIGWTNFGSGDLLVGSSGAAAVLGESGGTTLVSIGGDLRLAAGTGSAATCNLGGGTLSVAGNEFIGFAGNGLLNQNAGTHTVSGTLFLGFGAGSSGTCNLMSGGSLSAGSVTVNTGGRFNLLGGSLMTSSLTINTGGTFAGFGLCPSGQPLVSAVVAGTLMSQSGNLILNAANLNNSGLLANAVGSNLFINSIAVTNTGSISVNAQGSVVFNMPISNAAGQAITLMGGALGAPQIVNNGTLLGSGQISGDLVNNAAATLSGPTQIYGNVTNAAAASVTVSNSQLLITGLTTNNGTIRATSGGSVAFDGGLTGSNGAVILEPNSALLAPFIRQDSLTLRGTPGQPATFASASIRSRAFGGSDSTLRLLSIQTDGSVNPLGRFDLADTNLTVDGTATPPATVKAYLTAAYTANGDWSGPGGLTSSVAVPRRVRRLLCRP
jgi:hypothetical protein